MNQNEKMLNDKVSGATLFRNNLWELAQWAEDQEYDTIDLPELLMALGNALADSMGNQKNINLHDIFDSCTNVI